ncbi:MAG: right-handed parallel beta-helix repeat-containing protein [Chloroflexaceae bacterium]|nr:right-handed parallel beta-helix repeat-containing protein [Chloroflexaceae bacterium]
MNECPSGSGADIVHITALGEVLLTAPLPELTEDVTLLGPGANALTLNGNGRYRHFTIPPGVQVTIGELALRNGFDGYAAAIANSGTLMLQNCTIAGNLGTAIVNVGGAVQVSACTIRGNLGRGIFSWASNLELVDSTVSDHTIIGDGGGIYHNTGVLTIHNSTVAHNASRRDRDGGRGGGIFLSATDAHISSSSILNNTADLSGGGMTLDRSTLIMTDSRRFWAIRPIATAAASQWPECCYYPDQGAYCGQHR